MAPLEPQYLELLQRSYDQLSDTSAYAQAEAMLGRFQERFSSERLRRLRGRDLLEELHGRESRDCLAFWLEFRDDEVFRSRLFGSIRGGSALKFGIYQRADDNGWYEHGGEAGAQHLLSLEEAIAIAERQRDQLLAAHATVAAWPSSPSLTDFRGLQEQIQKAAPDLAHLAFLHKYLFLQFPDRLDDFHSFDYQGHHLLHMGARPPEERGLYLAAGTFVAAWHQFRERRDVGMPLFSHLLNVMHGSPYSTWRIGTRSGTSGESQWPGMKAGSYVAVGWAELGDLDQLVGSRTGSDAKEALREALARHYPDTIPQQRGKETEQLWKFFARIQERDRIFAADGQKVLAIGRVTGPYRYEPGEAFPHRRNVEWLSLETFTAPEGAGLQTTVYSLDKFPDMLLAGIRHVRTHGRGPGGPGVLPPLSGRLAAIEEELQRKGQVVLFGPPGTGKTWHALRAAEELAARSTFERSWKELTSAQQAGLKGTGAPEAQRIWMCTFHPAYGYEEFVEGLRPQAGEGGALGFAPRRGLLRRICEHASQRPQQLHFLLIDEFNRGDVARIFGELLTLLEMDKRGQVSVELPYTGERFTVPPNVRLIATMNTADRSISLLDTALRRRFGFIELLPEPKVLGGAQVGGVVLARLLETLNARLVQHLRHDARNLQVGHSFFLRGNGPLHDFADLRRVLRHELIPLLQEYCYDQPEALSGILGSRMVEPSSKDIRGELFAPGQEDELRTALREWEPSILTSEPPEPEDEEDKK